MGCAASTEAAQTHHVLHHFPCAGVSNAQPTSPDTLQRVVGRCVADDPNHLLNAPKSGRRCLYWGIEVWEEYWTVNAHKTNSRPEWRVVLSRAEHSDFKLRDGEDFCVVRGTTEIKFRVAGSSFRQARNTMDVPPRIQQMKVDKAYTWGQTYTYAGGVQTGLLQTGQYKIVEHTIAENDILTVLCYLRSTATATDTHTLCCAFPKESVYHLGTKGWTVRDRVWWDTLFNSEVDGVVANRMIISNRPYDADGVSVPKFNETRCAYCSLVSLDAKVVRLANDRHIKTCQLYSKRSAKRVAPACTGGRLTSGLVKGHTSANQLRLKSNNRRPSSKMTCLKGHPLFFETRRGTPCTWCAYGETTYHCEEGLCTLDMCADCYDLTRDASAAKFDKDDDETMDRDTLERMVAVAPMLSGQGRLKEAELFYQRIFKGYKSLEGEESLDALLAAIGLANVLQLQKKMDLAESTYRFVLKGMEDLLGPRSKNTLNVMDQLANHLYAEGKLKEGEELYKKVIELETKELGETHPSTLNAIATLAEIYEKDDKIEESISMHQRLLYFRETNMGVTHPKTEESREKLISLLKLQGREEEAKQVLRRKHKLLTERSPILSPAGSLIVAAKNNKVETLTLAGSPTDPAKNNDADALADMLYGV